MGRGPGAAILDGMTSTETAPPRRAAAARDAAPGRRPPHRHRPRPLGRLLRGRDRPALHRRDGDRRRARRRRRGPARARTRSRGARPAGRHAGLYHFALLYPIARGARPRGRAPGRHRARRSRARPTTASHEAIYLPDPDGNGIELAADRPRERVARPADPSDARRPDAARPARRCSATSPARSRRAHAGPGLRDRPPAPARRRRRARRCASTATCVGFEVMARCPSAAFVVRRRLPPPPRLQRLARRRACRRRPTASSACATGRSCSRTPSRSAPCASGSAARVRGGGAPRRLPRARSVATPWCSPRRSVGLEGAPEVHHRVGAPGPPALGQPGRSRRAAVAAEPLQRAAHALVAGREGVRVAERAHADVGGGPRPDAGDREQRLRGGRAVRARVQIGSSPSYVALASARSAPARARGRRSASESASARAAGVGEEVGDRAGRPRQRAPRRARRAGRRWRARLGVTCWPSTARTASSKPSCSPARAGPAARRSGARSGSRLQPASYPGAVGIQVEQAPAARQRLRAVALVVGSSTATPPAPARLRARPAPWPCWSSERTPVGRPGHRRRPGTARRRRIAAAPSCLSHNAPRARVVSVDDERRDDSFL